jgi:N-sulfoglucosamine sulfohydrolase
MELDRKMGRRHFLKNAGAGAAALLAPRWARAQKRIQPRSNILLITADDMNWSAVGSFGCRVPGTTPNIDRLAASGMRFDRSHVTIAVCQPSRECLMTGRYPHRNGGMGFEPIHRDVPTLQEQLDGADYINGILGKVTHLDPRYKFRWTMAHDFYELACGRDPSLYYRYAKSFFQRAAMESRPFFLMANSHDPHRPFYGSLQERRVCERNWAKHGVHLEDIPAPSRIYSSEDIQVPGFLPDIPGVRKEVAQYYCSVRRCDDTVGVVLRALREAGQEENTLVMFLSDNGMSFPFAKTNCYLNSTRTPWIVRWPGRVKPGTVNAKDFISGIDFMPTVLDAAGLGATPGMDGKSFLPLLDGGEQSARDYVFTVFHMTSARKHYPMRCLQTRRLGYIFNAWADGQTRFRNESQSGLTMSAMEKAAGNDPEIARRVRLFLYRVPEELYDFDKDPDALRNLVQEGEYQKELTTMRQRLLAWMHQTEDPLEAAYRSYLETNRT